MKIGFFCDKPPILNGGYSQRIMREINLVSEIQDVDLYMLVFNSFNNFNNRNIRKKIRNIYDKIGIKEYSFSFLITSKLAFNKNLYDKYYISKVKKFIKKFDIDILMCENLWCAYIGQIASKGTKTKTVFDYHGVVPEEYEFDGYCSKLDNKYKYLKRIEKDALLNCNSIICVSNSFKHYLVKEFNIEDSKINVVPCCINENNILYDIDLRNQLRKDLGIENKKVIIYAGSIKKYQCIEEMIWMFSALNKNNSRFYFIFLSAYNNYEHIKSIFDKYNVSDDSYLIKSVPHENIQKYYSVADYGLIIREEHILNKVASPTKIAEYLSSGLSIIATKGIGDLETMNVSKFLVNYEDLINHNEGCLDQILTINITENDRLLNYSKCRKILKKTYLWECYKSMYENEFSKLVGFKYERYDKNI